MIQAFERIQTAPSLDSNPVYCGHDKLNDNNKCHYSKSSNAATSSVLTPEGVKREKDVDRSQSITPKTGRKLDRAIIGILLVAVAWFAWDKFVSNPTDVPGTQANAGNAASVLQNPDQRDDKSVAVLPFVAMSSGPDDEYFADGLTEEILNSLTQLPELLVTARTSAFSFKGQDVPVQEIATALGVRHIVEGSVRRSGDRLRVTAQLVRANDGFHLWSNNYDSESTDTIAVQENIAEQIASALNVVLDEKKREAMRQAGLRDVEAFTIYQKAVEIYQDAHGQNDIVPELRRANAMLEQVIERVPTFSQVYMDHSDLFIHTLTDDAEGFRGVGVTDEDVANAFAAAIVDYEAAVRHARTDDVRLMTELDFAYISGDWRNLGRLIEKALQTPGCFQGNWTPIITSAFGYAEQYLKHSYDVLKCDPLRGLSWFNTSRAAQRSGKADEALRLAREGTEIAPGSWLGTELVRTLVAHGLYDEAREANQRHITDADISKLFEALVAVKAGNRARYESIEMEFPTPFDLDATPNFAAKLAASDLSWPPPTDMTFPDKDW